MGEYTELSAQSVSRSLTLSVSRVGFGKWTLKQALDIDVTLRDVQLQTCFQVSLFSNLNNVYRRSYLVVFN